MRLEILSLEEADYDAYCTVCYDAFKDALMSIIYPNGFTKAAREYLKDKMREDSRKPDVFMNKVIDHDLPDDNAERKVVGVAAWKIHPKERTQAELDAEDQEADKSHPPDSNAALREAMNTAMATHQRQILGGQPYVYLKLLAVTPAYHRKGVGSMLLRPGIRKADELGLQSYLEASPMGTPLYAKMGYETVCRLDFDAMEWGMGRELPHMCMLRPAKMGNGHVVVPS